MHPVPTWPWHNYRQAHACTHRQASMAAFAPWVVLEDSPAIVIAARGYLWNINGTGQSLISEPFPAALSAVEPQKGSVSFDRSNLCKDFRTVIPMSKHSPLLERCPSCTKKQQHCQVILLNLWWMGNDTSDHENFVTDQMTQLQTALISQITRK